MTDDRYDGNCVQFKTRCGWRMGVVALGWVRALFEHGMEMQMISSDRSKEAASCRCACLIGGAKTLRCLTISSVGRLNLRHDVSVLALSSKKVRFPGFTT